MSEPLIDQPDRTIEAKAARFTAMAERILLNKTDSFGGAFVIIPPGEGEGAVETLLLDSKQDEIQFWLIVKTKAETQLGVLAAQSRNQAAFPARR